MKSRSISMLAAAACAGLLFVGVGGCAAAHGKEDRAKTVPLDQAPAPVREAVTKALGDNKLDKLSKETEDGKVVYEAEFHVKGVEHSMSLRETGEIIDEEQSLSVAELPPAVSKAIEGKHPNATVSKAELVKADGRTVYEVDVRVGKAERELKVTADGQIQADEAEEHDVNDHD